MLGQFYIKNAGIYPENNVVLESMIICEFETKQSNCAILLFNKKLIDMMEYERVSRQVLEDGTYRDPYHVEPIELTKKRQRNILLVQHLLGWARYLF